MFKLLPMNICFYTYELEDGMRICLIKIEETEKTALEASASRINSNDWEWKGLLSKTRQSGQVGFSLEGGRFTLTDDVVPTHPLAGR